MTGSGGDSQGGAGSSLGRQFIQSATSGKKDDDDDDDMPRRAPWSSLFRSIDTPSSSMLFTSLSSDFASLCIRSVLIATVTLYVMNQKHMLPKPLSRVVSKTLFYPTIPITISRRLGRWTTVVDNAVVIGGAPFGWCGYPERLYKQFNVRGVVNMCDEYRGPVSSYKRLGIENLHLPTVDHFEPTVDDLKKAVSFIQKHESQGGRVYVHCRAGHGRSAAAVFAWLLYKEPLADPVDLNEKLVAMRDVRKTLWKQPNINTFRSWLKDGGMMSDSDSEEDDYHSTRQFGKGSIESEADDYSESDDSDENIVNTKIGQVFSDEEEDSSEEVYYDAEYDDDLSEDDRDYQMWRNYQRDDL